MKHIIIIMSAFLIGCTTVPVKREFPQAVPELMKKCKNLEKIEEGKNAITDMLKTVVENYVTYYECANRVDGWQEWYNEQKRIFDNVK